jgi:hypothetical protein
MDAQTQGFDVVYEIDQDSLLGSLENLVTDAVGLRLASLDLFVPLPAPAPANTVQHGALKMLSQPTTTLELPASDDPTVAALTIRFAMTLLSLDVVPGAVGFPGVGALPPTAAGELVIGFRLQFSAQPGGDHAVLEIATASPPTVSQIGALPNLQSLSAVINLSPLVQAAASSAVQNALAPLFPLPIPVPFGERGLCGIGARTLDVKLLAAGTGTKPALGFFLTLLDTSQGNIGAATESSLTTSSPVQGAIVLSNAFLKELVCCLFRQSPDVVGLPDPTSEDNNSCYWSGINNVQLATQRVRIEELRILVNPGNAGAQSTITLHVVASQSGTGWTAYAQLDVDLQLKRDGGALGVVQLDPVATTWTHISPWVWIIVGLAAALGALAGFVIGFVTAGWVGGGALAWKGGVIGAAIGLALVGVTYFVLDGIGSVAAQAISGVLGGLGAGQTRILPKAITDHFGTISDVVAVDFDDLFVAGHVQPPRNDNVLHEASDVVVRLGDQIDLDRGVIERAGETVAGFALEGDLLWRPDPPVVTSMARTAPSARPTTGTPSVRTTSARIGFGGAEWVPWTGTITPLGTARLAAVAGTSFWSLTESALGTLNFSGSRVEIGSAAIVRSDAPYPVDGRVFAVRTTAGRLAKCLAWRDAQEQLHLSYVTYNTAVPLSIASQWTITRGPVIATTPTGMQIYQVARTGRFDAIARGFGWFPFPLPPTSYMWLWDDQPLVGSGVLPDGTTTFAVYGDSLRIQTAMGTMLHGVLQVELTAFGGKLVATVDLDESGTVRESTLVPQVLAAPDPTPTPIHPIVPPPVVDQIPAAFARGMGIPIEHVKFQ